jgi:hypothetical protein
MHIVHLQYEKNNYEKLLLYVVYIDENEGYWFIASQNMKKT